MPNNSRGFILLRTILAILVITTILPISVRCIFYVARLNLDYSDVNDELALMQLRRTLMISYDLENYGDLLRFIKGDNTFELKKINGRLVLEPGYQMFLDGIDDLYFIESNNCLIMVYEKNGNEYETPIFKSKGIYIDDFSDNFDFYD